MWLWAVSRKLTFVAVAQRTFWAVLGTVASVPLGGLLASDAAVTCRLLVGGLFVLSVLRPPAALLIVAAFASLGGVFGYMVRVPFSLTEPMVFACLAGWFWREVFVPTPRLSPAARTILRPAFLLGVVITASMVVGLAAQQPFVGYPRQFLGELGTFFATRFFVDLNRYEPLTAGMEFLGGLGLFWAAVNLSCSSPGLARALARMTVAGAVAVGLLSLNRLGEVLLRNAASWQAAVRQVMTIRISAAFPDVNAAGSYFAMAVFASLGVGAARPLASVFVAAALAAALALTGSRAALFAVPVAGVVMAVLAFRGRHTVRRRGLALSVVAVILLSGIGAAIPFVGTNPDRAPLALATRIRWDLARAGLAMAASQPVFGVGIGAFKGRSGLFFNPEMRALVPRENAHNYFVQLLAELGLIGFAPFTWMLAATSRRVWLASRGKQVDWPLVGTAGGIFAFLLTWMAGHPLMIKEVSPAFWILFGACAAMASETSCPAAVTASTRRLWAVACAVFVAGVALTIPARAGDAIAGADLRLAAIGYSAWEPDESGKPVRWATAQWSQFFIAGEASGVRIPLRLVARDQSASAEVSVYLDSRLAGRVRLASGVWSTFAMLLPDRTARPYHQVEIEVGRWFASRLPPPAPGAIQMGEPAPTRNDSR